MSFNHNGDRGRIDLVAFHPVHQVLLVIEMKTALVTTLRAPGGKPKQVAPTRRTYGSYISPSNAGWGMRSGLSLR